MAHNIKSPGVSVQVKDQTSYPAAVAGTVAAAVGFAEKGPINEPTLILSKEEFANTFGSPIADNYYLGMFADKYLDVAASYFTRVALEADYEAVVGTIPPNFTTFPASGILWVELEGFPEPNNGLYRVVLATTPTTLATLITALNTAFSSVTLADGLNFLGSYITAQANVTTPTLLEIKSDLYRNVIITIRAETVTSASNIVGIIAGTIGIADGSSSTDVGNFAYSYLRVPITAVAATPASIVGTGAMVQADLDKLSGLNKVNISVDGNGTNPYKTYTNVNIKPTTGTDGTFPALTAPGAPTFPLTLTAGTFDVTLTGFYHFEDATHNSGNINVAHSITVATGPHVNMSALVAALNAALVAVVLPGVGKNLQDYVQFASIVVGINTVLTTIKGTAALFNFGAAVQVTLDDTGTANITQLGYVVGPNSAPGTVSTFTAAGVAAKITAAVAELTATAASSIITLDSDRLGTTSFIKINNATLTLDNAISLLHFTDSTSDTGSNGSNSGVVNFVAKDAGTWGDNIKVRTYTTTNPVTMASQYYIEVYYNDESVEIIGPIDWIDPDATNYIKTLLEASNYLRVDFGETVEYPNTDIITVLTATPPNSGTPNPDYWQLAGGGDGIPASTTTQDGLVIAALDEYSDREQYVVDLILAPGFSSNAVVAKLQSVGEARQDVVVLVDPPPFLTYIQIIDWHNGSYLTSTPLTSSHVVLLWDWQRDFDAANSQYVDLPPSIYEAVAMARTEKNFELWEAPAGPERGIVNSISSYSKPSQAQREYLYNDTDPACVNPIVQFPAQGILIYGQKTCLKLNKATNRINVRRLVNYIKRNVELIGSRYLFTLNQASTWASISREITSFLANIQERGGLQSFSVIFDASTTTADYIDAGIMYGKIFIQPTRVAERIFIDLTIQRTGALVTEV